MSHDAVKDYLRSIGSKGGQATGPTKARKHTGKALRDYWAKVKSGEINRKPRQSAKS